MTETQSEELLVGGADVCGDQTGGKEEEWPRFGPPLHDPVGGGQAVEEKHITWTGDLD